MSEYWQPIELGSSAHSSCLNCPPKPPILRYKDNPSPGFGIVQIKRDGVRVAETCRGAATLIRHWRAAARVQPDHEWTIEIEGPMSGVRYTRQPNGRWMATHRTMGFA